MRDSKSSGKKTIREVPELRARKPRLERVSSDIAGRKKTEEKLRQSEQRFRSIFDNANDIIGFVNTTGKIIEVNKKVADILGYKPDELIGKNFMKCGILPIKNAPRIIGLFKELVKRRGLLDVEGGGRNVIQLALRHKRGHTVFVEASTTAIKTDGKLEGFLSVLRDITERKTAEPALKESEEKYRQIVELAPDGILTVDLKGMITSCNTALLEETGYSKDDFVGRHVSKIPTARLRDIPKYIKMFNSLLRGNVPEPFESEWIHKDGTEHWSEAHVGVLKRHGKRIGFQVITRDITERKRAEQALRESEERLSLIYNTATDIMILLKAEPNGEFNIVTVNDRVMDYFAEAGISKDMICKTNVRKFFQEVLRLKPEDIAYRFARLREVVNSKRTVRFEVVTPLPNGSTITHETTINPIVNERHQCTHILAVIKDITEYKKAEQALRESEEKFRNLAELSPNMIFINQNGKVVYVNNKCVDTIGYTKEEFYSNGFDFLCLVAPEHRDLVKKTYVKHTKGKGTAPIEYALITKAGERIEMLHTSALITYRGETAILGTDIDITERKKTEEALRNINKCFLSFSSNPDENIDKIVKTAGFVLDGTCALYNKEKGALVCTTAGWNIPEDHKREDTKVGHICYDVITKHEDEPIIVNNLDKTHYAQTDPNVIKYGLKTYIGCAVKVGHKAVGALCIVYQEDKTFGSNELKILSILAKALGVEEERKKAEEALRESEKTARAILNATYDLAFLIDTEGTMLALNETFAKRFGKRVDELIGSCVYDLLPPDVAAKRKAQADNAIRSGRPLRFEDVRQGRHLDSSVYPVFDANGQVERLAVFSSDITNRKRAKEALSSTLAWQEAVFQGSRDAVFISDADSRFVMVNRAASELTGFSKDELLGMRIPDLHEEEDLTAYNMYHDRIMTGEEIVSEAKILRKDGTKVDTEFNNRRIEISDTAYMHAVARDITERKRAEEKLLDDQAKLKSLASQLTLAEERERRRIATELHDRIGQSLVISKMNLEALRKSGYGKEFDKALDEICNSLGQTIADTRTLTFDLSSPILHQLGFEAAVAEWLTEQIEDKHGITAEFEDDGRFKPLDDDIRILLFRDVRELLINVVRHARANKVKVSIRRVGKQISVSVEDDGVGFDPAKLASTAAKRAEFGLFSIRQRLEELGGHLEIKSELGRGCRITIRAPLKLQEVGKTKEECKAQR